MLLLNNRTTIESMEKQRYANLDSSNLFDLGWRRNFVQVMGSNPFLWFFPILNSVGCVKVGIFGLD